MAVAHSPAPRYPPVTSPVSKWVLSLLALGSVSIHRVGHTDQEILEVEHKAAPTVVAGTLAPLVVSVDGKTLIKDARSFTSLKVNGIEVPAGTGEHLDFFTQVEGDLIQLEVTGASGQKESLKGIQLPRIETLQTQGRVVLFKFSGTLEEVLIDKRKIPVKRNIGRWRIPSDMKLLDNVFSLHMKGSPDSPERFYDLKLSIRQLTTGAFKQTFYPSLSLTRVGVNAALVYQKSGASSLGPALSWAPWIILWPQIPLYFHGNLGVLLMQKRAKEFFPAIDLNLLVAWPLSPKFLIEVGPGLQSWIGFGGTSPTASLNLAYNVGATRGLTLLKRIGLDRLFLGYLAFFATNLTHQAKIGAEFMF